MKDPTERERLNPLRSFSFRSESEERKRVAHSEGPARARAAQWHQKIEDREEPGHKIKGEKPLNSEIKEINMKSSTFSFWAVTLSSFFATATW